MPLPSCKHTRSIVKKQHRLAGTKRGGIQRGERGYVTPPRTRSIRNRRNDSGSNNNNNNNNARSTAALRNRIVGVATRMRNRRAEDLGADSSSESSNAENGNVRRAQRVPSPPHSSPHPPPSFESAVEDRFQRLEERINDVDFKLQNSFYIIMNHLGIQLT